MTLSTYYLEDGYHLARLRRRRVYALTSMIAMITIRKSIHGFPLHVVSYMGMGLRLAALPAGGAPL